MTREYFDTLWMPEPNSGCWLWIGTISGNGYGRVTIAGRYKVASRVSWELKNGTIPDGLYVCHKCDTPACVNPDHLFLGTNSDNQKDSYNKNRRSQNGENGGNHRLTLAQVRQIRSSPKSCRELASRFGIGKSQVSNIKKGTQWTNH